MAARLRLKHQEEVKEKIRASQLQNRLLDHISGKIELTQSQVDACKFLLNKIVSNAPTEVSGPDGDAIPIAEVTRKIID